MRRKLIIRPLLAGATVLMISAGGALAAKTPEIRVSSTNQVPSCVTPERLMEFVGWRNKRVAPKFGDVATYYQLHGTNLGLRWDYAFYQMLVETNYLKFRTPSGRWGSVKPKQNNFAGLGASGGGRSGESFRTVSDGVLAHLQHVQMYSGHRVTNPVAKRTRNIQDWNLILPWAQAMGREVTFTDLTTKWSPSDRGYSNDIEYTARKFRERYCGSPDQIIAKAPSAPQVTAKVEAPVVKESAPVADKTAFTASIASKAGTDIKAVAKAEKKPVEKKVADKKLADAKKTEIDTNDQMALGANMPGTKPAAKCAVWTASYGGGKSLLIRSTSRGMVNYTALVVHEGQESREAEAYIKAWAKGGKAIGEFGSSDKALKRAYELCPQS